MKIAAKIVKTYGPEDKLKAIATVCLAGQFLVTGVRIVEGKKGLAVFVPSIRVGDDEFRDICFPITPDCRNHFNEAVMFAYEQHLLAKENAAEETPA